MFFRKSTPKSQMVEEIERQKDAIRAASRRNVEANQDFVTTVKNNGFTVIIAAAMGAKRSEAGNNNGH